MELPWTDFMIFYVNDQQNRVDTAYAIRLDSGLQVPKKGAMHTYHKACL